MAFPKEAPANNAQQILPITAKIAG